jgi:hypothetical protein
MASSWRKRSYWAISPPVGCKTSWLVTSETRARIAFSAASCSRSAAATVMFLQPTAVRKPSTSSAAARASSHGTSDASLSSPLRSPVRCTTPITTASAAPAIAPAVSSHCQNVTSRHQAGGRDRRAAATERTASASACGTMPALPRAASRRLAAHGLGSAPPTESANAVIALSTSDCCACPAASAVSAA